MVKNSMGARPPLPQINARRFVPINLYHEFNSQSRELINESMASLPHENYNYHLDELNWQDLLATVNQKQQQETKVVRMKTPPLHPPPPPTIQSSQQSAAAAARSYTPHQTHPTPPPPTQPQTPPKHHSYSKTTATANIVYPINLDPNPQIVHKRSEKKLNYTQEVAVRYLKPSTPDPPGDIIIRSEENSTIPPAPPLVIRQVPPRPRTPPPLIIREQPPSPPEKIPRKVITITRWATGHSGPPPPRKVVVERLPQLPPKPRSVIIERWLPYEPQKRKVILHKGAPKPAVVLKPKNVIIQWEPPETNISTRIRDLGTVVADPAEYVRRFGDSLIPSQQLPAFVRKIPPPKGERYAADYPNQPAPSLYGDVDALKLIDLEREGLGQYKHVVSSSKSSSPPSKNAPRTSSESRMNRVYVGRSRSTSVTASTTSMNNNINGSEPESGLVSPLILNIFSNINQNRSGQISIDEMNKTFSKLNKSLGRDYGPAELNEFFSNMDANRDGYVDLTEFKNFFKKNIF